MFWWLTLTEKFCVTSIILWFIAVGVIPLFQLITGFTVDSNLFLFGGYIGYFILGIYLMGVQVKTKILKWAFAAASFGRSSVLGLWLTPSILLGQYYYFFYTLSANVIIASVALFMLLSKYPRDWPGKNHPRLSRLAQSISVNTLPIFFFHVIVLETLYKGLLGLQNKPDDIYRLPSRLPTDDGCHVACDVWG